MFFPLFVGVRSVFVFVLLCIYLCPFSFCNHLEEEEKAGCFTITVIRSTSESRVRLARWNWFKPSSKIFYWLFQSGTSFVDLLCLFLFCVCCPFVRICLYVSGVVLDSRSFHSYLLYICIVTINVLWPFLTVPWVCSVRLWYFLIILTSWKQRSRSHNNK